MIAVVRIGKSTIAISGSSEGIAEVVKNHVLGALRGQAHRCEFSIDVPVMGSILCVSDEGEVAGVQSENPIRAIIGDE